MKCNNYSEAHDLEIVSEDENAIRAHCKICKSQVVCRKDERGVPEKRQYAKEFKRLILQGNDNLLYKYNEHFMNK